MEDQDDDIEFDVQVEGAEGENLEDLDRRRKSKRKPLIVDPEFAAFHFAPKKAPPKKLVIKQFRKNVVDPEAVFKRNWAILSESIEAIQNKRGVRHSLEHLYQTVENLFLEKKAPDAYLNLIEMLRVDIIEKCNAIAEKVDCRGIELLLAIDQLWEDYTRQMDAIQSIFLVLDRMYVLPDRSLQPILEKGMSVFHDEVLMNFGLGVKIGKSVIEQITIERNLAKIDTSLIRSMLRMLHTLNVYSSCFEREFLASTSSYYAKLAEDLLVDMEIPLYLGQVSVRLAQEQTRCDSYLVHITRPALISTVERELIEKHQETIVKKGTSMMLDKSRLRDLNIMYDLLGRCSVGRTMLKTEFSDYIKKQGRTLVTDPNRDNTMVKDLMAFKMKIDECVDGSFRADEKFSQASKDAFDYFINTRPNRPAELIAKFMDARLRAGNKESSEEELDTVMDRAVHIFRFIQGKDVFEAFYKRDLAKRLLLGRSASVDAEKAMLSKLRAECGSGFTHKLEGMFKDMDISQSLAIAFRQYCTNHDVDLRPDITVNVLTMGMWPKYDPSEVVIPPELGSCLQSFDKFYIQKHNGRKLQWQHSLGQALLRANFQPNVSKEIQVSLFQATTLFLFNTSTSYSYEDIRKAINIDEKELCRTLQSLACGKYKVLIKSPKGREVEKDDTFSFNSEFKEKLFRIRICQVQMKETEKEKQQTEEEVSQDRLYQIDAAVVRIMKTRKTLSHQQLIQELFSQLRFPVKAADLKKRIASLIERDYMNRDSGDTNIYHYVA